ncbi:hypothetical protein EFN49_06335 [Leuconostoc citreum]|uniref:Ltp family lipoprotein n=1 Tax=Leuconostoc citreum TaxID=33964 RepID=UPI0021A76126|nr:Ltp family lipoprotein [Leuconostoc citreum]MCT3075307.1 hypothetical protein [Leuconostoc citreum]
MAKKITDENGNTYVQKKPFYKRVWFWIIAVVVIAIIGGSMGGNKNNTTSNADKNTKNSQTVQSSSSEKPKVSAEYTAALKKATTYSNMMNMSKAGIYHQLTSEAGEKFPDDAAQYAIDNLKADYNKNALKKAKSYQKNMSMSTDAIQNQLTSEAGEKFTQEEAAYAIQHLND